MIRRIKRGKLCLVAQSVAATTSPQVRVKKRKEKENQKIVFDNPPSVQSNQRSCCEMNAVDLWSPWTGSLPNRKDRLSWPSSGSKWVPQSIFFPLFYIYCRCAIDSCVVIAIEGEVIGDPSSSDVTADGFLCLVHRVRWQQDGKKPLILSVRQKSKNLFEIRRQWTAPVENKKGSAYNASHFRPSGLIASFPKWWDIY